MKEAKAAMSGQPAPPGDFASLYRRAFENFGASALWSSRPVANPTPADALAITQSLRVEGNLQARQLAEQIERACRDGRREPRDVVDLLTIHDRVLRLGAVVLAAAGKALGFTPEGIINEIRRIARYTEADFRRLASDPPVDPADTMTSFRAILSEAESFIARMPTDKVGLIFLQGGNVVEPDPDRLQDYQTHAGQRRGQWPSNAEIITAMFERSAHRGEQGRPS